MVNYIVFITAFLMGMGGYDPIFGNESELSLSLFFSTGVVVVSLKFWPNYIKEHFDIFIILAFIFFSFSISNVLNLEYYNGNPIQFFKFLFCIVFYIALSVLFEKDIRLRDYVLFYFFLGVAIFTLLAYFGIVQTRDIESIEAHRISLGGYNANDISFRAVLACIGLYLIVIENKLKFEKKRFLLLAAFPLLLWSILISASRGSFLIFMLFMSVALINANIKTYYKIIYFLIFVVIVGLFISSNLSNVLFDRFAEDNPLSSRTYLWENAVNVFYDYPIFGTGIYGYQFETLVRLGFEKDVHNQFLYILVSGGIVLSVLFCIFYAKIFLNTLFYYKKGRDFTPLFFFFLYLFFVSKTGCALWGLISWFVLSLTCISNKQDSFINK